MKISEFIEVLKKAQEEHGDIDVVGFCDEFCYVYPINEGPAFLKAIPKQKELDPDDPNWKWVPFPVKNDEMYEKATDTLLLL